MKIPQPDPTTHSLPVGYIVDMWRPPHVVYLINMGSAGWRECDGGTFAHDDHPEMAEQLRQPRPVFRWRKRNLLKPFALRRRHQQTLAAQERWDEGYQYLYGGTRDAINLPNLRARLLP